MKIKNGTLLSDNIYEKIKAKILAFDFAPGTSLTEERLCQEMNVSRTPVREALRRLQFDDLVEIVKNRGVFVRSLTVNETYNVFIAREALEGVNTRYAAETLDAESLEEIDETLKEADSLFRLQKYQEACDASNRIHDIIVRASGNRKISTLLDVLSAQISLLNSMGKILPGRAWRSHEQHLLIFAALRERNGALAEQRMREHIIDTREDILLSIRNKLR